ncbi:hypothetical protein WKI68_12685 [Streptomyces sp. MS1.HAVA.3]|uniref:Uncharacterized protein n=1 Tax=Streptomyces caledonius TaxID=3134107 RepID=A0ABU8U339_9ACTN
MELLAGADQTVLVALHDLTLAARYCDRLLLMHRGRLVACGAPAAVLTPEHLAQIFEVDAELATDALGRPAVAFRGPLRPPVPDPHGPPTPHDPPTPLDPPAPLDPATPARPALRQGSS